MNIRIATLCDYAQVREGLLSIMSAGITRVHRPRYPAPAQMALALMIEADPSVAKSQPHEIRMRVENEDGMQLAEEIVAGFQMTASDNDPGEMVFLPVVADFRSLTLPSTGRYQVVVKLAEQDEIALSFRAILTEG